MEEEAAGAEVEVEVEVSGEGEVEDEVGSDHEDPVALLKLAFALIAERLYLIS